MTVRTLHVDEKDPRNIVSVVNQLAQGRSNATGSFSLTASDTTTTVTAPTCGAGSVVTLQPKTANAAAELGAGTIYVSAVANGSFTVTHANDVTTDRTFGYVCLG